MKKFVFLFALSLALSSCGGDDGVDCNSSEFNSIINQEVAAVNAAGQAWATDPTTENCNAFKQAAQDYISAVEDFGNCNDISQTDYNMAIQAAREAANSIPC